MAFIHCAELLGVCRDFFHFLCKLLRIKLMFPYLEAPVEATIRCSTTGAIIHKPA
jgi:hypothetical protein